MRAASDDARRLSGADGSTGSAGPEGSARPDGSAKDRLDSAHKQLSQFYADRNAGNYAPRWPSSIWPCHGSTPWQQRANSARRTEQLRLVALTGFGQPADLENTKASGFDAHLTKPASDAALRAAQGR